MKSFYRRHTIEVNAQPNGQIVYDIYQGQYHVVAGFSQTGREQDFLNYARTRVDQLVKEAPVVFRS